MRSILLAALCACALASAAVAGTYRVMVSGFSDGAPVSGLKYLLAPEEQLAGQGRGLEMDEFGRHVERALSTKGMVRVFSAPEADLLITLGYGIGANTHDETRSIPIMGQTGTVQAPGVDPVTGKLTTVTKPVQGVVGYNSANSSTTEYASWMRLVSMTVLLGFDPARCGIRAQRRTRGELDAAGTQVASFSCDVRQHTAGGSDER